MLRINQRLDKLVAMHIDFATRGMLPAGHPSKSRVTCNLKPSNIVPDGEDSDGEDAGPLECDDVLAHVILAQTCGTSLSFLE